MCIRDSFGGEDSLDKLTNLVEDSAKVAVFTDKGIEATGLAALVTAKIEQAGKEYVVFDEPVSYTHLADACPMLAG